MAVREAHPQALAPRSASVAARHVCGGPRLVDKDQVLGSEIELASEPGPALLQDVGPLLLDRVPGLFFRVMA